MRVWEESVNAPVPKGAPVISLVVAVFPFIVLSVPHAKPRTVAFAPPVLVMLPLNVAEVCPTGLASEVVTVGIQALVVKGLEMGAVLVPIEFTAYGR